MLFNRQPPVRGYVLALECLGLITLGGILGACSTDSLTSSTEQKLKIEMLAVYESPSDAEGTFAPIAQTFTLTGVVLSQADTDEALSLFTGDPLEVRVIERSQLIFQRDISSYEGTEFEALTVKLDATVVGEGKLFVDHKMTLDEPDLMWEKPVVVKKGQGIDVVIRVLWNNTVTRDEDAGTESMSVPELEIKVGK